MMRSALLAAIIVPLFAAPVYAQKPQIQWNKDYDFDAIGTFQWQLTPDTDLEKSEPFLHSRIKNAIEYQLTASGLTEVQSNPDVYVNYSTSTSNEVRLQSDSYGYGFGGYGRGGWGYYGYRGVGPVSTTTRVTEYQKGTLVVDIWDAKEKELVWRGAVTNTVPENVEKAGKLIDKAVQKMADQGRKLWAKEKASRSK
jgi:Domain of unknown function (DUF4136)